MERVIKVFQEGDWVEKPFNDLQVEDKFQIFDGGSQFIDTYGHIEWTVKANPKTNKNGIAYVEVEEETI